MEGQSRVLTKGIDGLSTVNSFSIHYRLYSWVKKVKSALVQASHTTRAYPDLLCQISHVVFICLEVNACPLDVIAIQPAVPPIIKSASTHVYHMSKFKGQ